MPRKTIAISLDTSTLGSIKKNRQLTTVSRFIENCVLEYLDKKNEGHPKPSHPQSQKEIT